MISPAVVGMNRVATTLLGVGLTLVAALLALWGLDAAGRLPQLTQVVALPDLLDFTRLEPVMGRTWWPWATGGAALVLGLLGLVWLFVHLPRRVGSRQALTGTSEAGRLSVDLAPLAGAVAEDLGRLPGVRTASSAVTGERGRRIIELRVTAEPGVRLDRAVAAVERGVADLATALGGDTPLVRTVIRVGRDSGAGRRVR